MVTSCSLLRCCYRWEMTTERIGTNFAGQAAPPNLVQSSPLLVAWNQRIRRNEYTCRGLDKFAGELLSELLSYRVCFLDTDRKSQQRGLVQILPGKAAPQNLVQRGLVQILPGKLLPKIWSNPFLCSWPGVSVLVHVCVCMCGYMCLCVSVVVRL